MSEASWAAYLGPDDQPTCVPKDIVSAVAHVRACTDPACESFAHDVVVDAARLLTIERAAHALLDAIGPDMAGLDGAPPAVVEAATALQVACVGAR